MGGGFSADGHVGLAGLGSEGAKVLVESHNASGGGDGLCMAFSSVDCTLDDTSEGRGVQCECVRLRLAEE